MSKEDVCKMNYRSQCSVQDVEFICTFNEIMSQQISIEIYISKKNVNTTKTRIIIVGLLVKDELSFLTNLVLLPCWH